jgi:murein DD-endopeptidase MepM/ murein hydrolase activator NlpD
MKANKKSGNFLKQKSYVLAAVLMVIAVFGMVGVYITEQTKELQEKELQAREEQLRAEAESREDVPIEDSQPVDQIIQPENSDFMDDPAEVVLTEDATTDVETGTDSTTNTNETTTTSATTKESTKVTPPATEETPEAETPTSEAQETISVNQEPILSFAAETEMQWPLQGNVILNFSMDQTVYFATLDQYKYNPAVIIQGQVNEKVASVADGKITNIETNEVTGCTVTVDLGDGYSAVYGQLKEVGLHAGDYIEAGATVGYISEPTKYYSVEGPNLYFQLIKDNVSVDPMTYLQ